MKTRTYVSNCILVLSLLLFTITCQNEPAIETIEWEPDGSVFRQFKTNDSQYYDWAFWYRIDDSFQSPMVTVESEVKKMSGCDYGGLGIIFCFQDHDNFYVFVINIIGEYAVFKRLNGSWSTIIDWPYSSHVITGHNTLNNLKVTHDDPSDTFTLYINGNPVDSFTDSSFSDGYSGYECYVADESWNENFPNTPADFRFRQILPVTDP
jgi:hypothetical protein